MPDTVPVKVGDSSGALSPILVVIVVAKLGSSPIAAAISSNVLSNSGEESTRFATAVPTNAVVATAVELSPAA